MTTPRPKRPVGDAVLGNLTLRWAPWIVGQPGLTCFIFGLFISTRSLLNNNLPTDNTQRIQYRASNLRPPTVWTGSVSNMWTYEGWREVYLPLGRVKLGFLIHISTS